MKEELLDACWEGKIEKVRRILQLQPHLVESQDKVSLGDIYIYKL